ncbi:MAG TPA: hypothetical protein VFO29_06930 [Candidatus Rubrimentiphilum sp.]|nr:hypothetical protein [Candidatus Rubrimentiphilum sp.]
MVRFGQTCAAIAARAGKLEKIALLAEYLRSLSDADLSAAARFFTGNPFAARDQRSLGIGYRTIVAAARNAWGFDDAQLGSMYRERRLGRGLRSVREAAYGPGAFLGNADAGVALPDF